MKTVCLFGSSHFKYLGRFDCKRRKNLVKIHEIAGERVKFIYKHFSGKSFDYFIDRPHIINKVLETNPDYLIVLFGGNLISLDKSNKDLLLECRVFYELVADKLKTVNSSAKLIGHQVPLRFNRNKNNRFRTPPPEQYKKVRDKLYDKIKNLKCRNYMITVGGPGKLDNEKFFFDGTHLDNEGLKIHSGIILEKISTIISLEKIGLAK